MNRKLLKSLRSIKKSRSKMNLGKRLKLQRLPAAGMSGLEKASMRINFRRGPKESNR